MKKTFSHKLIVSDIDGTLALNYNEFPQRNVEAIRHFVNLGGFFTIATGRTLEIAQPIIDLFQIQGPVILVNGACIYDTRKQKYIRERFLPDNAAEYLKQLIQYPKLASMRIMADDGKIYNCYTNPDARKDGAIRNKYPMEQKNMEDILSLHWRKAVLITESEDGQGLHDFCSEGNYEAVDFTASSDRIYEMIPKTVSKGNALHLVAQQMQIKQRNTIAIGDYDNDFEMLQSAGFSATPENGTDQLKAAVDTIVCHCRDGALADLVEYLEHQQEQDLK